MLSRAVKRGKRDQGKGDRVRGKWNCRLDTNTEALSASGRCSEKEDRHDQWWPSDAMNAISYTWKVLSLHYIEMVGVGCGYW